MSLYQINYENSILKKILTRSQQGAQCRILAMRYAKLKVVHTWHN